MKEKKRKYDVLVVGELNVDLILNDIASLPQVGKEIIAGNMTLTLGSSSAIFASNISTLGVKTAFAGMIGIDSFGELVLKSLEKKSVNTDYIIRSNKDKTGITIVLNYDEDRAMVTHPGAMEIFSDKDVTDEMLQQAGHLHVSSVFLQKELKKNIVKLFRRAKKLGLTTSLDVQWDPDEKWDLDFNELLPLVDIFMPNKKEMEAITGYENINGALEAIKNYTNIVAVKMGNKGSLGFKNGKKIEVPPFLNTQVVDAIGAGDSFNAGFISQFIKNKNLESCLKFGNLMGAINTTANGGTGAFKDFETIRITAKEKFNFDI
jgi:sugar/nucleoside kinase (ribokinase family)